MKKLNLFFFASLIMPFTLNAQIIFEEDFEDISGSGTEFPENWLLFNVDNNVPATEVAYIDQAWKRMEEPEVIGNSVAMSTSYYTNFGQADDWMWTPEINIPSTGNSVLSWDAHCFSSDFRDGYEVRIMLSPNTPTGGSEDIGNLVSASTLLFSIEEESLNWNNHFLVLDETYNGQTVRIGFRNHSTDKYLLAIDNIEIQHSNAPLQQRIYVKKGSSGDGSSWVNAMGELADALVYAKNQNNTTPGSISEIWVAGGTYHPLYSPDDFNFGNPDNRNNAFLLLKGVAVYGGFAGTENSIEERDLNNTSNNSILNGDLLNDDVISDNGEGVVSISNNSENTYHVVVTVSNDTSELLIDGFEIVSGNANGSNSLIVDGQNIFQNLGGGFYALYSEFEATNLKFNYNTNTGLYVSYSTISVANSAFSYNIAVNGAGIRNGNSELEISNSEFFMNSVSNDGGAIYNGNNGITRINNSEIHQNLAVNNGGGIFNGSTSQTFIKNSKLYVNNASWMGGAIFGISSSLSMVNSLIYKNTAEFGGAIGMFSKTNATTITNSTFYDNSATNQGHTIGIDFNSSEPENLRTIYIYNSILWGNDNFTGNNLISENWGVYQLSNSILQYPESGYNINGTYQNINPLFNNPDNNNFTIPINSPAVNIGDNSLYENSDGNSTNNSLNNDFDLAGNSRLFDTTIDVGAYENNETPLQPDANNILYVDKNANGLGDGSSWTNAVSELAYALKWAKVNESNWSSTPIQIWVAGGTYKPLYSPIDNNFGNDAERQNSFLLVNGVSLYGGFAGNEGSLSERNLNLTENETILSGDVDNNDVIVPNGNLFTIQNNTDNNYHIVVGSDINNLVEIDGFIIKGGMANGPGIEIIAGRNYFQYSGGGISLQFSNPVMKNLKFTENYSQTDGAGAYLSNSAPSLNNLSFEQNYSNNNGGGIWVKKDNNPNQFLFSGLSFQNNIAMVSGAAIFATQVFGNNNLISNSKFNDNFAGSLGGAIAIQGSQTLRFVNNIFIKNRANYGGAISLLYNRALFTNSTFYDNQATGNGHTIWGEYNPDSPDIVYKTILNNCIIWTNDEFTSNNILAENYGEFQLSNSILQYPGSGYNITGTYINQDPFLTDWQNDDFSPLPNSPAVNAGNNTLYETADGNPANNSLTNDLDMSGNPRLVGVTIDIGAYETQATLTIPNFNNQLFTIYPNPVKNNLHISSQLNNFEFVLFNLQGQKILEGNNINILDVSALNAGFYILKFSNGQKSESIKIIKE